MDETDLASLRSRREGVNRGLWWGEGGVPASLPARRFHIIGVGLPKTGTTSLASLFRPFRWGQEFLFAESIERLVAWKDGRLEREGMRRWLAKRAEAGALELDSASFNHYFLEMLVELHPSARFVYTRRDAVSWTDSFLNMALQYDTYLEGHPWPGWQLALGRLMAPSFDPAHFASPERLRPAAGDATARGRGGKGAGRDRGHHLPGASQHLGGWRSRRALGRSARGRGRRFFRRGRGMFNLRMDLVMIPLIL